MNLFELRTCSVFTVLQWRVVAVYCGVTCRIQFQSCNPILLVCCHTITVSTTRSRLSCIALKTTLYSWEVFEALNMHCRFVMLVYCHTSTIARSVSNANSCSGLGGACPDKRILVHFEIKITNNKAIYIFSASDSANADIVLIVL